MYGPKSIWVILLFSPRAPFPSGARSDPVFVPLSRASLRVPLFWLSRPTKVSCHRVYTCRAEQPIQPLLSTRCPGDHGPRRRESCTRGIPTIAGLRPRYTPLPTSSSFTDLFSLVLGLSFVSQFPITRLRMIYAILYFTC